MSKFFMFSSSDCNPTLVTAGVFLDITKTFDRVCQDRLLLKLKENDVTGNLFQLITSFFSGIFRRVLLNGQTSDRETIEEGVPLSPIFATFFFSLYVYMKDLKRN